ncbi:MAG: hypothetical protein BM556_05045 [Bacteriovorax sp. MedPE-SWde]|nr:MAG: hypothetical protein BM556_05045 [Bacteriovorax sp. MedPE-SWde]
MTKLILLAAALIFSVSASADRETCLKKLTYEFAVDSRAFKVDTDSIRVIGDEKDYLAQAVSIVRGTLDLHGCDGRSDINFGHGPLGKTKSTCRRLIGGRDYSLSCYVESDLGYFFITRDLQTNAFVVFSRWD